MKNINSTVVIFAAHPDDEVLGCGGTIAKLTQQGSKVHVVFLADGESSRSDIVSIDNLILQRKKNAIEVASNKPVSKLTKKDKDLLKEFSLI